MAKGPRALKTKALLGLVNLLVLLGIALFLPAGSLRFWQAWIFLLVFSAAVLVITLYFMKRDPQLIESRLRGGPTAEKEKSQKVIQSFASMFFIILFVVPGFDHRFRWSDVPPLLVILGDIFVALGFLIVFLVFKSNSFTSAIIEVNRGQGVISTGPYRIVRHPMYAGALLMCLFTPLALGSYWGLLSVPPMFFVISWRLVNEEKFLTRNLPRYDEYRKKTRFRLIPFVW